MVAHINTVAFAGIDVLPIEAQVAIKDQLILERRKKEMEDYLSKLRDRTPVWTIFDDDSGNGVQTASGTKTSAGAGRSR